MNDPDAEEDAEPEIPQGAVSAVIPLKADGARADKALAGLFPDWSRERLQESFAAKQVWRDGRDIQKRTRVQAGDTLTLVLPEPIDTRVQAFEMPLEILYEDEVVVVVNKASGVVVHPGAGVRMPTLCHGLLHHTGGQLARAGGEQRPGVVHRLDRDTSGAIVFAKTDSAYYEMVKAFSERLTLKEYRCLVVGAPKLDSGTVQKPIGRHPVNRVKMTVRESGKPAHTDWRVLERFAHGRYAYVHCRIHTGRTHQIRIHLSDLGCPIWGDSIYGYQPAKDESDPPGHFLLHAEHLAFPHPLSGKRIDLHAPLPEAFTQRLAQLRSLH